MTAKLGILVGKFPFYFILQTIQSTKCSYEKSVKRIIFMIVGGEDSEEEVRVE